MLEAASGLDHLLLSPFGRDPYPGHEFLLPLEFTLRQMFLSSKGLRGQDMGHVDRIWLLRRLADLVVNSANVRRFLR
jgi:hypothetical protein